MYSTNAIMIGYNETLREITPFLASRRSPARDVGAVTSHTVSPDVQAKGMNPVKDTLIEERIAETRNEESFASQEEGKTQGSAALPPATLAAISLIIQGVEGLRKIEKWKSLGAKEAYRKHDSNVLPDKRGVPRSGGSPFRPASGVADNNGRAEAVRGKRSVKCANNAG